MNELIAKIEQWAEDRNIIKGSKPIDQAMKLFSEFGELADNVGKGRDCKDDIGDVFVVLTIMCKQQGRTIFDYIGRSPRNIESVKTCVAELSDILSQLVLNLDNENGFYSYGYSMSIAYLKNIVNHFNFTLEECVEIAYNDIKDRKGLMHNGVFIKESDPAYASVVAAIESNYDIEEDKELNAIADSRKGQKRISVNIEDL